MVLKDNKCMVANRPIEVNSFVVVSSIFVATINTCMQTQQSLLT